GRLYGNVDVAADHRLDDVGDLHQRVVLISDIVDSAVDPGVVLLQQEQIGGRHVRDMQVGALLRTAEHADAAGIHGQIGQDVDDDIEPLPRRVAANGGRADRAGDEAGRGLVGQIGLAHGL